MKNFAKWKLFRKFKKQTFVKSALSLNAKTFFQLNFIAQHSIVPFVCTSVHYLAFFSRMSIRVHVFVCMDFFLCSFFRYHPITLDYDDEEAKMSNWFLIEFNVVGATVRAAVCFLNGGGRNLKQRKSNSRFSYGRKESSMKSRCKISSNRVNLLSNGNKDKNHKVKLCPLTDTKGLLSCYKPLLLLSVNVIWIFFWLLTR